MSWLQEEQLPVVEEFTKCPNLSRLIAGFYLNDQRLEELPLYEFVKPQINDAANGAVSRDGSVMQAVKNMLTALIIGQFI